MHTTIDQIKQLYRGQRIFKAKNNAYSFDLFDDVWLLELKRPLKLVWMQNIDYKGNDYIETRLLLAKMAAQLAPGTVNHIANALKALKSPLTVDALIKRWPELKHSYKKALIYLTNFTTKHGFDNFKLAAGFVTEQKSNVSRPNAGVNILDPRKGVYSEFEYQSIQEQVRLDTGNQLKLALNDHYIPTMLNQFSITIAIQFMVALVRRPTQLNQMKWCDILPVGHKFADNFTNYDEEVPEQEPLFSDVEVLHVRTFRGKDGQFRKNAEKRSHRLEPDLSRLVLLYRQKYEGLLTEKFKSERIDLSQDELQEVMNRLPLFFSEELLSKKTVFENKTELFKVIGSQSRSFHKGNSNLIVNICNKMKSLKLSSDRIEDDSFSLSNNRLRHHVLTAGALSRMSGPELASITGVTIAAIRPYIELNFEARLQIDQALANHQVLSKFASQSISDLQQKSGFVVLNEFDEELGINKDASSCFGCQSRLGAPMGCYGCDNFLPDINADHQQILEKAQTKYEVNLASSNKDMLRKLCKSILYIKATITVCNDQFHELKGVKNGD